MNHQDVEDPTHTGRTILTALYLCMLGVCFVVPIFFYFRMHCDDRHNRRLRDLEIAGITQAMNESQDLHREESRAARRKYREERRARIFQLFIPVRMILTEENFIRSETDSSLSSEGGIQKKKREEIIISDQETSVIEEILDDVESADATASAASDAPGPKSSNFDTEGGGGGGGGGGYNEYNDDNDDAYILVPKPGLPDGASIYEFNSNLVAANKNQDINDLRKVPNECSICLCEYIVGSDLVYSSNPQCDHVFHAECIEQWIMKQRDGPLCPCCRRDFVIDPFDDVGPGGEKDDDIESCNNSGDSDGDRIIASSSSSSSSSSVQSQSALVQQQAESMSQIDESSASDVSSEIPQQTTMTSPDNISSNHSTSTESINTNDDDEQHQDIMRDGVIPISITPTPILEISNILDV